MPYQGGGLTTYDVDAAGEQLPSLIDRALGGEEIVIMRDGEPVAEIRPIQAAALAAARASYEWLVSRRLTLPGAGVSSVELLNQVYDDSLS